MAKTKKLTAEEKKVLDIYKEIASLKKELEKNYFDYPMSMTLEGFNRYQSHLRFKLNEYQNQLEYIERMEILAGMKYKPEKEKKVAEFSY